MNLLPEIYVENAAIQYTVKDGVYVINPTYMRNVAKSVMEPEVMSYLKNLFGNSQQEWYDNLVSFIEQTKQLRKQTHITYEDFVENFKQNPGFKEFESAAKIWGNLTRKQAEKELNIIYQQAIEKGISEDRFKEVMKNLSLLELARLYFSTDVNDQTEAVGIRQAIEDIENGKDLNVKADSNVRFVVTAFRPTLIREQVAKYYRAIINKTHPELEVISTGQTTISIYKKGISKYIPLRQALDNGVLPENIIYTGDEFDITGVDYPIYILKTEDNNSEMVVISTHGKNFEGDFISLGDDTEETSTFDGNIKRSVAIQRMILSIIEEQMELIATDPEYNPVSVAQVLSSRIKTLGAANILDFNSEAEQPEIPSITDLMKAG